MRGERGSGGVCGVGGCAAQGRLWGQRLTRAPCPQLDSWRSVIVHTRCSVPTAASVWEVGSSACLVHVCSARSVAAAAWWHLAGAVGPPLAVAPASAHCGDSSCRNDCVGCRVPTTLHVKHTGTVPPGDARWRIVACLGVVSSRATRAPLEGPQSSRAGLSQRVCGPCFSCMGSVHALGWVLRPFAWMSGDVGSHQQHQPPTAEVDCLGGVPCTLCKHLVLYINFSVYVVGVTAGTRIRAGRGTGWWWWWGGIAEEGVVWGSRKPLGRQPTLHRRE